MSTICGTVRSHTVIRVPDKQHTDQAPFVLLLVALDSGFQVLGHFNQPDPPEIGSRVASEPADDRTPVFCLVAEKP